MLRLRKWFTNPKDTGLAVELCDLISPRCLVNEFASDCVLENEDPEGPSRQKPKLR